MSKCNTFVLGLVGGVAAGKSHVAGELVRLGAVSINADEIGHQVLMRPAVIDQLAALFGPRIIAPDRSIDRRELGALVFGADVANIRRRQQLEQIVHPLIRASAAQQLQELKESIAPPKIVVIDAPLLLEADWAHLCDAILFIDTPLQLRQARAQARGWDIEQFRNREAAQLPLEEKKQQATHIIAGDAKPSELARQLQRIVDEIQVR